LRTSKKDNQSQRLIVSGTGGIDVNRTAGVLPVTAVDVERILKFRFNMHDLIDITYQ